MQQAMSSACGLVTPDAPASGRLLASRGGGGWNEQTRQGKVSNPKRPKTKLGLPDLDHSKSAVFDSLRSRESKRGIDTPSMNLFSGTVLSPDCRSTRLSSPVTEYSSRIGSSRRERSTDDSPLYGDSPTRPQTLACSARNSPRVSDE